MPLPSPLRPSNVQRPRRRATDAKKQRFEAAEREKAGSQTVCQRPNRDKALMAKFHKTLPHNELGEVDEAAFAVLQDCIISGDFDTCESIPNGGEGYLVNPLGGMAVDLGSPCGSSTSIPPAPTLSSPEMAGHMAECYWMSLTRDVPFTEYGSNPITKLAAENLAAMEGFPLDTNYVAMGTDGSIDPEKQLYRPNFLGVDKGPYMSQLLANDLTFDSIDVEVKQTTNVAGVDYMTDWENWLNIQNGGTPLQKMREDPVKRFIRNGRDLARLVHTDTIYTEAFRGAMVLLAKDGVAPTGANGPYLESTRQRGFTDWGPSHFLKMLGRGEGAQRNSWYQKWHVHMTLRPEAMGGIVHRALTAGNGFDYIDFDVHPSLLGNTELLDMVFEANAAQNEVNDAGGGTYLLSQALNEGSPAHPSYPAGHAVQNGAYATILKAMCGERGDYCVPDLIVADPDGKRMIPYTPAADERCIDADTGLEGLTFAGEINKMGANVAFGRNHLGVHYRFDSTEGMLLGETVAVRILHAVSLPSPRRH
ncbi:unnamed protein product [Sphacelaria rigidula]